MATQRSGTKRKATKTTAAAKKATPKATAKKAKATPKPKATAKKAKAKATPKTKPSRAATMKKAKATPAPRKAKPGAVTPAPTTPTAPARFAFEALPVITAASELTPLLRRQLVVDTRLGVGRTTTPDRIPAGYLDIGVHRWRVTEAGAPVYELVQNTLFFADSDEPLGIERIQGSFDATGRSTTRGRALDLVYLAWELNRDWPHRRFDLDPPPARGTTLRIDEGLTDEPWPADARFV